MLENLLKGSRDYKWLGTTDLGIRRHSTASVTNNPSIEQVKLKNGLSIGICFPETCSAAALNAGLDYVSNLTGIQLEVNCPVQLTHWTTEDVLSL